MLLQSWAALPRTRSCARLRRARTLRRSASLVNRTAIEIVANNVNFAAPKSANAAPMGDAGYGAPTAAPAPRPAAQAAPAPSYSAGSNDDFALIEDEGDLPF